MISQVSSLRICSLFMLTFVSLVAHAQSPVWFEDFNSKGTGSKFFNVNSTKVLASGGVGKSKCLEVTYERYNNGGSPRLLHKHNIPAATEYTLNYDIYFDNDWNITTGGKFHGLVPNNTTSGCKPIEADGWSARAVFASRKAYLYTYHQDKNANCGDKNGGGTTLDKGKWYAVSLHVKLNSADNKNDGFARLYINGNLAVSQNSREFRSVINNATKITKFYFSTFLGGSPTGSKKGSVHARFDNFGVYPGKSIRSSPGGGGQIDLNQKPTVSFTNVANAQIIEQGYDQFQVIANATDSDGTINNVKLLIDGNEVRAESNAPYEWGHAGSPDPSETLNLSVGQHTLKLIAEDNDGAKSEKSITIQVTAPNSPPEVSFDGSVLSEVLYEGYNSFYVLVNASDPDGQVMHVKLEIDGNEIRQEVNPPYEWGHAGSPSPEETLNLLAGMHTLKAVVTDDRGGVTEKEMAIEVMNPVLSNEKLVTDAILSVYPNPSTDGRFQLSYETDWEVFDLIGHVVAGGHSMLIDLTAEVNGIYLLQIDGQVQQVFKE